MSVLSSLFLLRLVQKHGFEEKVAESIYKIERINSNMVGFSRDVPVKITHDLSVQSTRWN